MDLKNNNQTDFISTDFGFIPKGWSLLLVKNLIDDKYILGHLDGNHGELYPRSHEFKESGVPYIGANDFSNGFVSFQECKYLTEERASKFKKGVAIDGDVLFAHNATVGPVALLKTKLKFVILSTTVTYYRCNTKKLNNKFLQYALQSQLFVRQYKAVMAQSTRNQVPITAQRKFALALPPLKEQNAIANALSDTDEMVENLEKLIEKKRNIKQGLIQKFLTPKENWRIRKLSELVEYIPSGNYGYENKQEGLIPFPVVTTSHIDESDEWNDNPKHIRYYKQDVIQEFCTKYGDLIVVKASGSAQSIKSGKIGFISRENESSFLYSNFLMLIRPINVIPKFLYYYLTSYHVKSLLPSLVEASTYPNLKLNEYFSIEVNLPPESEQNYIVSVLDDLSLEIMALEHKKRKFNMIKQGMMQVLLNGKIRLS